MPRAANSVADDQSFRQRAAVVRAVGADGKQLTTSADQHHVLVAHMAEQHPPILQPGRGNTLRQINGRLLLLLAHASEFITARGMNAWMCTPACPWQPNPHEVE